MQGAPRARSGQSCPVSAGPPRPRASSPVAFAVSCLESYFQHLEAINWVANLVGALILSILGKLIVSLAEKWLGVLSAKWAERGRKLPDAEHRRLEKLRRSPVDLTVALVTSAVKVFVFFALASAIITLSGIPEQYMSDRTSLVLMGFGTLLYFVSIFLAADMFKTVTRLRSVQAEQGR